MRFIAIPGLHCSNRPIILKEPDGKHVARLLQGWWRENNLPYRPIDLLVAYEPFGEYVNRCVEANKKWIKDGLIKPTLEHALMWQRPFAVWLRDNHGYEIIEPRWIEVSP